MTPPVIAEQEEEATQFAMELLMPKKHVEQYLAMRGPIDICDEKPIKLMAAHFRVPWTVMAIRLGELRSEKRHAKQT